MYTAKGQLDRDALIRQYQPLVRKLAHHMMAKLPASVQVDDLIQVGLIGLSEALSRYEAAQGVQFKTSVFRSLAEKGIELRRESVRRARERDSMVTFFVYIQPDGRVSCTVNAVNQPGLVSSLEYANEQEMPEVMQDRMAVLRFTDSAVFLPEVGKRVKGGFWLLLNAAEVASAFPRT
jgi:DNA-directed RNA polymerase specialized sigma24 family protein